MNAVRLIVPSLMVTLLQSPLTPQTKEPRRSDAPPALATARPPALIVRTADDGPPETLAVTRMDVQATIDGFLAETTTTLTFHNGHGRALEGELVFPLPEGATLSGYALDVNGVMVDGVVVERHEARIAFEKEVRRGVDPGLVEWAQGNNFRTRVWPIPAHGTRTVRVRYVSRLIVRGSGAEREACYLLPFARQDRIGELSLRVEVVRPDAPPQVRSGGLANFGFEHWQDRYVAETRLSDFRPERELTIALPGVPEQTLAIESDDAGLTYFAVDGTFETPAAMPRLTGAVGLLWDASLSRDGADRERELAALARWLERVAPLELDVVVFRNEPEPVRRFTVRSGQTAELITFLRQVPCDGGTRLGGLSLPEGHAYDVLVSDGLDALGGELPVPRGPLYALNSDSRANHAVLDHLARASGGAYLNLQETTADEAAAAIGTKAPRLVGIDYDPEQVTDVRPGLPSALRGRITVTGRLLAPEARLSVRWETGNETRTRTFTLRRSEARPGRLVPRLWAEQRMAELSVFPERHQSELLALGRRFGIVTPGASLLVLERLEQYVEHHVEPPRSLPAMREAYLRHVAAAEQQAATKRKDKLEQVVAQWQERVAWWQREFPRVPAAPKADERKGHLGPAPLDRQAGRAAGVVGGAPVPPPPPTPAMSAGAMSAAPAEAPAFADLDATHLRQAMDAERSAAAESVGESDAAPAATAAIVLKPWDPDMPYLRALRAARPDEAYATFLRERREHGESPAFFLDCADHFAARGERALALRVLTDVVELRLAEPRLLRIAAHRLQQLGELDLAVTLFEQVLKLRPEEPQSLRDLALALVARAERQKPRPGATPGADYGRALELLNAVVLGDWDGRFPNVEVIALEEANRIAAIAGLADNPIDARLRQPLTLDLRVVLTWDTDLTDMDLWVVEPSGERCYYSHALTSVGGAMTRDFTQGYGPEVYAIRRALPGRYKVQTNFYGSGAQSLTGPTTVQATVITDFGRPNEKRRALTLRLSERKEIVEVGEVEIEAPGPR